MKNSMTIYSVFGQIEEVAANRMLEKYAKECRKIEVKDFAISEEVCPELFKNAHDQPVRFAILMPRRRVAEFETLIETLRA